MVAMAEDRLLTVPEVAERLRVSKWSVLNWLRDGKLEGYRPGGTKAGWRVKSSDVDRFLAQSKPGAGGRRVED